jgi:hypothetical protein
LLGSPGTYETGEWYSISVGSRDILELATDGTYLYALTGEPISSSAVLRYQPSENPHDTPAWETLNRAVSGRSSNLGFIQTICGAVDVDDVGNVVGGKLFASTNNQLVVYEGDAGWRELKTNINLLNGVAYLDSTYYLAVKTEGIYTFDGGLSGSVLPNTDGNVVAVMPVKDRLVALYSEGGVQVSNPNSGGSLVSFPGSKDGTSTTFSGSIGLWQDRDTPTNNLLLVGIQGGYMSTIHGYREIPLDAAGFLNPDNLPFQTPGSKSLSSVNNNDRYNSTIGIHVITALHQAKDGRLFAATTKNGLWSYKKRDGKNVWNAEE